MAEQHESRQTQTYVPNWHVTWSPFHAGQAFQPYAESVFERCLRLAATQLAAKQGAASSSATSKPADQPEQQREFIIGALDLISGMAEGLGPSIEPLIERASLRDLLLQCCQVGGHPALGHMLSIALAPSLQNHNVLFYMPQLCSRTGLLRYTTPTRPLA